MHCPTLNELPPSPPGYTGWPWTQESPQLPDAMSDGSPWPRVSIVTPSYNQGQFIEETIRSVLLQGYPNLEYIIIDGGSTDESVDVIRRYGRWLAYWVSELDKGQTDAIAKGWHMATGELLGYQNSDDTFLSGAVQTAVRGLLAHPEAGAVYGDVDIVDPDGKIMRCWKAFDFDLLAAIRSGAVKLPPATGVLWRRRELEAIGGIDENLQYDFDFDLYLRMARIAPLLRVPASIATYRVHDASKTGQRSPEFGYEVIPICRKFYSSSGLTPEIMAVKNEAMANGYLRAANSALNAGELRLVRRYLLQAFLHRPRAINKRFHLVWLAMAILGESGTRRLSKLRQLVKRQVGQRTT